MKAFLILEDGHVFKGTSIGSTREVISEIVFNTSMTGQMCIRDSPKDDNIGQVTITREYIEGNGGPKILLRGQEVPLLEGNH